MKAMKAFFVIAALLTLSGYSTMFAKPGATPRVEVQNVTTSEFVDKLAQHNNAGYLVDVNGNRLVVTMTNFVGTARYAFNVMDTSKGVFVTVSKSTQVDPVIS